MSTATAIILEALDDVTIDALVTKKHAQQLAEELADALEARGYALRKKPAPRKPAAPAEVFAPNTGNPELDAFMRAHHRPDWEARLKKACARTRPGMMTMPAPAPGHASKPMTQQERADLWRDHKVIQHSA
jgi:hypothetical protein